MGRTDTQRFRENLATLQRYCAYRERCTSEVINRAVKLEISQEELSDMLELLKADKFLDDARYAESFVRGKFRSNRWGRARIRQGLFQKGLEPHLIEEAMKEINSKEYQDTLCDLARSKLRRIRDRKPFEQRALTARFLQNKGYELPLIMECLNQLITD